MLPRFRILAHGVWGKAFFRKLALALQSQFKRVGKIHLSMAREGRSLPEAGGEFDGGQAALVVEAGGGPLWLHPASMTCLHVFAISFPFNPFDA